MNHIADGGDNSVHTIDENIVKMRESLKEKINGLPKEVVADIVKEADFSISGYTSEQIEEQKEKIINDLYS